VLTDPASIRGGGSLWTSAPSKEGQRLNADKLRNSNLLKVSLSLATATPIAWLLVASGRAEAAFVGTNGRIAFQSERDGNREIYR